MREGGGEVRKRRLRTGNAQREPLSALLYTFWDVHSKGKGYFVLSMAEDSKGTMSYRLEPEEGV